MTAIPTISVVIPCYNSGSAIRETIDSVLANTGDTFRIEVVAVDDGSSDDTVQILQEYGSSITLITKENGGACRARNDGIRAARGQFIALCDHDDLWEREKLALQLEKMMDPSVGLVCSDADSFSNEGVLIPSMAGVRPLKRGNVFRHLLHSNFIIQSSVLIRREVFDDVGFFAEEIFPAEDLDLWLRIAQKWQADYVDKVLVHYRVHEGMFSRNQIRMRLARIPVIRRHLDEVEEQAFRNEIMGKALGELAMDYWYARRFTEANKQMKEAISYSSNVRRYLYLFLTRLPESLLNNVLLLKMKLTQRLRKKPAGGIAAATVRN